ncbi:diguanylate cyclase, partial [Acidithiobacillus ferrooxidans]|nr:diguanylate cyclase [Acidithiobacillus ferrooxidans]
YSFLGATHACAYHKYGRPNERIYLFSISAFVPEYYPYHSINPGNSLEFQGRQADICLGWWPLGAARHLSASFRKHYRSPCAWTVTRRPCRLDCGDTEPNLLAERTPLPDYRDISHRGHCCLRCHTTASSSGVVRQSLSDTLTGLPNRRSLEVELEHAFAYADPKQKLLAVCILALSRLKRTCNQNFMFCHFWDQF